MGRVAAVYRYPVKSAAGQRRQAAAVTAAGFVGDRRWAAYPDDGGIASGKRTRRFRPVPGLMAWASTLGEDDTGDDVDDGDDDGDGDQLPMLISPQGARYRADDPRASAALAAALGQRLTLRSQTSVTHHDESPVHLLTTSSLAAVAGLVGGPVDHRRFRPNLVVDTGSDAPAFVEDGWTGGQLVVGSEVVLDVGPAMPRCAMVDQAQAGVVVDARVLRPLGMHHDTALGVQAGVRRPGTLRRRGLVTLVAAPSS